MLLLKKLDSRKIDNVGMVIFSTTLSAIIILPWIILNILTTSELTYANQMNMLKTFNTTFLILGTLSFFGAILLVGKNNQDHAKQKIFSFIIKHNQIIDSFNLKQTSRFVDRLDSFFGITTFFYKTPLLFDDLTDIILDSKNVES